MAKRKSGGREHRWGGAGYVCADCGAIKHTFMDGKDCPGTGGVGFDLWLYHAGAGWWLEESGIRTVTQASLTIKARVGKGNVVAAAVLPAGQRLGLFTAEAVIPPG